MTPEEAGRIDVDQGSTDPRGLADKKPVSQQFDN
tara:strand:+ start:239 stop:340 length:102 start_codon:yes stop_codon:yes gene_type:complete